MEEQRGPIEIWHGSDHIVARPDPRLGNAYNDYGRGFYCTEHRDLAYEWACTDAGGGFANRYELATNGLTVLNLGDEGYGILNWLALLVDNRKFTPKTAVEVRGISYLTDTFLPDISGVDLIIGYRADDSYFSFARSFLRNALSVDQLSRAMRLGELGEQYCLKSPLAFRRLEFRDVEPVDGRTWFPQSKKRDQRARESFRELALEDDIDGLYMRDIIREGVRGNDPRLR